ncbi:MAG: hypothetical protein HQ485_00405 [Acidobacteria bacterium]|jgi:uncharacterized protein|nr:hypothetical protein [Acidobacteriota bacterium]
MAFIGWIVRILAVLILVRMVLRLFSGGGTRRATARSTRAPATREGGRLVRDPHCGTYVPVTKALRSGNGDSAVYFCSDACRTAWATRKAG